MSREWQEQLALEQWREALDENDDRMHELLWEFTTGKRTTDFLFWADQHKKHAFYDLMESYVNTEQSNEWARFLEQKFVDDHEGDDREDEI